MSKRNPVVELLNSLFGLIFILWVTLWLGCSTSDSPSQGEHENQTTGDITFSVKWVGGPNDSSSAVPPLNCRAMEGVSGVLVEILDSEGGEPVATGGPWDYGDKGGVVQQVPVGTGYSLMLYGRDSEGTNLYEGSYNGFSVTENETTPLGRIDAQYIGPGSEVITIPFVSITFEKLPDTGQTQSYTNTFGEDSDYTINPPSYTKLGDSGEDLSDGVTDWAMVRDDVTDLIWEVKKDDGSIHDKDDKYTWQAAQDEFIPQLNNRNFGGYNDWRMPSVKELSTIVNSGLYDPAINTDCFPNTVSSSYWSATTGASDSDSAWRVSFFGNGFVDGNGKSNSYYVRAVRGGQ